MSEGEAPTQSATELFIVALQVEMSLAIHYKIWEWSGCYLIKPFFKTHAPLLRSNRRLRSQISQIMKTWSWARCKGFTVRHTVPCCRNAGWTRDPLLEDMRAQYVDWCRKSKINGANRLWTAKILKPKSGEYPSVLQKVMKGAAARVLVHWCAGVSHAHASNTNSEKDWYEPRFLTLHIQCYACCICC